MEQKSREEMLHMVGQIAKEDAALLNALGNQGRIQVNAYDAAVVNRTDDGLGGDGPYVPCYQHEDRPATHYITSTISDAVRQRDVCDECLPNEVGNVIFDLKTRAKS